ncbi:hypothetical protein JTE90_022808 [Oedothorax gibbosus]|uniref:Uridine 5'-monophosphate synthase n=1 Tax=Oedothorax gibbosus TaxID=931172 RepID=A0AAV6V507_9ARAC|nr:hypothetical protein JTE90_022808 [Oedothorax gibbosus]
MADNKLLDDLLSINVFRVGEFRLKSGVDSPIYIDLRGIIAYPSLIRSIADAVYAKRTTIDMKSDIVCGVPYTALPIASLYSVLHNVPMVLKRKEAKDYGTKKIVEGIINKGDNCLILEDIVSSGSSVIETAEVLRNEGLVVTDCIVFLNREQGGQDNLEKAGIRLHSLFTLSEIFDRYCTMNKVDDELVISIKEYIKGNKYIPVKKQATVLKHMSFEDRAKVCHQPVAKQLMEIVAKKQSNLCVALDVLKSQELLDLADKLGPFVCMIKTHIDILLDFKQEVATELKNLATKHNFLIFEDRKFADIGSTVKAQYNSGLYKISEWADVVTIHGIPGDGIVSALKESSLTDRPRACILIAEMSSSGALTDDSYQKKVLEMAQSHPDFVIGFVGQKRMSEKLDMITFTPGVNINSAGDSLGQQYKSPEMAVENGADVIIVGRGIIGAEDPVEAAKVFMRKAFEAYMKFV